MSAHVLMVMGTGSDVGKSLIVAGLCRAYALRGLKVMPFKPQNMSNNAAVTADGGEIGRAQALQARAAFQHPITAMNPVLLKPEHESGAQIIVRGKRIGSMPARQYFAERAQYLPVVLEAFRELADKADLVLVEGAGSASEINLRQNDIANFGFARAMNAPVILLGDIQRGGVIASLVGTFSVIEPKDEALIVATLVNRFQGDPSLFEQGLIEIATRTNRPCFGPIPHFNEAHLLPAEDILGLQSSEDDPSNDSLHIVVPRLPRIANFDDFDPLKAQPNVRLNIVSPGQPLPLNADLIILPGSKSTRADLEFLKCQGWDIDIKAHVRRGGNLLGICAGYQMLGHSIADLNGIEGAPGTSNGLGLLDVKTTLSTSKQLRLENAEDVAFSCQLNGYHMHMGDTIGPDCDQPFSHVAGTPEGAKSANGQIIGTYLHGLFSSDEFREKFLKSIGHTSQQSMNYEKRIDQILDRFAAHLEKNLDLDAILKLAKPPQISRQSL